MAREVESWYEQLPEEWRERAQRIRELILEAASGMEEKWMFKSTPFYLYHGWLIYLNFQKKRLVVGFCNGIHMSDPERLFARTDHTQIRHFLPQPSGRMNEAALRRLIDEAVRVNEAIAEERRTRKRTKKRQR